MLQAALASGAADGVRCSRCSRGGCPTAVGTAWWPASAAPSTRSSGSGSTPTRSTCSREHGVVDERTLAWLADYRFSGDVWGYPEGEIYFPYSPLLVVESTFAEAVLLETVLLSIYNHDSAIASAASRMTWAAGERPCIEMGSRRTHEEAAVAAARAAYVAGFATTSNLAARQRYGIPTTGHQRAQLHAAARHRARTRSPRRSSPSGRARRCWWTPTTWPRRCSKRVEVAGTDLGAVRLDSGDLGELAHQVRAQLDSLGATGTRIMVTSDLDEHAIAALASAPVDGYGVGTSLVTGSGHPTCGFVYKLVAREGDRRRHGQRREAERRQDLGGRPQVRPAPPLRRPGSPRPR